MKEDDHDEHSMLDEISIALDEGDMTPTNWHITRTKVGLIITVGNQVFQIIAEEIPQ